VAEDVQERLPSCYHALVDRCPAAEVVVVVGNYGDEVFFPALATCAS
jgi:hypothetical protein